MNQLQSGMTSSFSVLLEVLLQGSRVLHDPEVSFRAHFLSLHTQQYVGLKPGS